MEQNIKLIRTAYKVGVVAFIIGAIDPLEGSVLILAGSLIIAVTAYLLKDRHWKIFTALLAMIIFGVFFLFYLSSLGGFGGTSELSWWYGALILPYPIAWLIGIGLLIYRIFKQG